MTPAAFTFAPMDPNIEELYMQLMAHADNCMNDVQTHEHNLALHIALCGNAFPGLQRLGRTLLQQSCEMELEAREMAHHLLTSGLPVASASKKSTKPYYRPGRW